MDVTVVPGPVDGVVRAPPSKSYTHRAILAGGYGETTRVEAPLWSRDTRATARAVEALGGAVDRTDGRLSVEGVAGRPSPPADVIDCANSGTTMRLVTAAAALAAGTTVLTGDASLRSRPQGPLLEALRSLGATARATRGDGRAPLVVTGPIEGGTVSMPGDVSSQFVTALLMAGAVTPDGVTIELETALKSAPYVDITVSVLADFGVDVERTDAGFAVAGGQSYAAEAGTYAVPGDFSSISYLLAIGAVGEGAGVEVTGARPSAQGDAAIVEILERMGATVEWDRSAGRVRSRPSDLAGVTVSVADTPDLLPTVAALGAAAEGETRIVDAEHVRYKETDRVSAMAEELERLGATTRETPGSLTVEGGSSRLEGAVVDGRGDHRIVMALAVAATAAAGETTIRGADHVDVSFPGFFDALEGLGVTVRR